LIGEDILVSQEPSGLGKGHHPPSHGLKLSQTKLAAQSVACHFAATATNLATDLAKKLVQISV
jgi:hypothetical protein